MKPPLDYLKINVDASFWDDALSGTTGIVIRGSAGDFVAAANQKISFVSDAESAEAMAVRAGMMMALSMGCVKALSSRITSILSKPCPKGTILWSSY